MGDAVSSSGPSRVTGPLVSGEVDGAGGVEGFLRGAGREPGAQDGILVAVVSCGVDREAEGMSRAAGAQAAEWMCSPSRRMPVT